MILQLCFLESTKFSLMGIGLEYVKILFHLLLSCGTNGAGRNWLPRLIPLSMTANNFCTQIYVRLLLLFVCLTDLPTLQK